MCFCIFLFYIFLFSNGIRSYFDMKKKDDIKKNSFFFVMEEYVLVFGNWLSLWFEGVVVVK